MNKYELALVVSSKIEDEVRNDVVEKAKAIVVNAGGQISDVEEWGKKKLAYEIQKMSEGFYYFIHFDAESTVPAEVESRVRILDNVLRFFRGPLGNPDHSLLAVFAALQFLLGNQHIVYEDVSFGNEESEVLLYLQLTYGLIGLVAQDFSYHGLLDVILATGHHGHAYTVAIEGEHGVAL